MNKSSPQTGPSLLPREHGAYAEMAFPQVTALVLGGFSIPAMLITAAVACAFLLHEPALVMMGRRGPRALKTAGVRAKRRVAVLLGLGAVCGVTGLVLSSPPVWLASLGMVILGIVVVILIAARLEKTVWGESVVALAFAGAAVPTALAGDLLLNVALAIAGVWAVVFVLATLTVNVVIDRHKSRRQWTSVLVVVLATLVVAAAIVMGRPGGEARAVLAVLPVAIASILVILFRVTPRRLWWLGWSMVVSNTAALVLLLVFLG